MSREILDWLPVLNTLVIPALTWVGRILWDIDKRLSRLEWAQTNPGQLMPEKGRK